MGDSLARIQTIDVDEGLFPIRPDLGNTSIQESVQLWANYFAMELHKRDLVLYLYNMAFEAFPQRV